MSKDNEINEDELMEMMAHPFSRKRVLPKTEVKEEPKQKKIPNKTVEKVPLKPQKENKRLSYKELFLQRNQWTARKGKTIYIRQEYHERLSRIISVIGNNELSVSDFVDKLLEYHFLEFETEIKKQFKENYKPIL